MFLLGGQVLLPDLLPLDLLVIHLLHLTLQLTPTVLNVEDLATLQPLLIAEQNVDDEDADGQPDHEHRNDDGLETDMVDDGQTVLLVNLLIIELLFDVAVGNFLPDDLVAARAVLRALPERIDVEEGAKDDLKQLPEHVARDRSQFDAREDRLKHGDETWDGENHGDDVDDHDSEEGRRL